eukprot:TRINITY_DN737_c5_g1_i1.p1 TRINITY_DN737_c5_g1~~TRINITY_DN737_c5_g1_i1.p1  ORF type:complete len:263 (+),score=59.80 TRINITY_DN737_c5_g1_i1:51-791(+)
MTAIDFAMAYAECLEEALQVETGEKIETEAEKEFRRVWRPLSSIEKRDEQEGETTVIEEFINKEEEDKLLRILEQGEWVELVKRRLQNWGGYPHPDGMAEEGLPDWLKMLAERIENIFPYWNNKHINQALINEYTHGQGIAPHKDGPNYTPYASILSLSSAAVISFAGGMFPTTLPLPPRSLCAFAGSFYQDYTHEIPVRPHDAAVRYSITLRHAVTTDRVNSWTAVGREELKSRKDGWIRSVTDK